MPDNAKPGPELTVLVSPEPEPVMDPQPGLDSSPTRELADVSLRSSTEGSPESPNSELEESGDVNKTELWSGLQDFLK
jgi:hypothetical protein